MTSSPRWTPFTKSGCFFEEFTPFAQDGVTVTGTSDSQLTISGTPTANTSITIPDAKKYPVAAPATVTAINRTYDTEKPLVHRLLRESTEKTHTISRRNVV